jgi:Tfp pilus assembly protein PilV
MRKKILLSIGLIVCIGIAVGIYLYQKPRTAAASQQTDFTLSADDLYKQFETNETAANQKYAGKILEVTGTVGEVQKTDSAYSILLTAKEAMGGINCSMALANADAVQQGKNITIKGKCAGFLMDVNVLDAVIVNGQ